MLKPRNLLTVKRSPKRAINIPTESQEAIALIHWAQKMPLLRDLLIHIPNEGKRTPLVGRFLRLQGMRAGVSDYFLPLPRGRFHGAWIELKRVKGSGLTQSQKEWLERMTDLDYATAVCYGCEEAISFLSEYLQLSSLIN